MPLFSFTGQTDSVGKFALDIMPGIYDIRIKVNHTISTLKSSVNLTTNPGATIELGEQLEGDHNGDNIVDVVDYSQLLDRFGWITSELST